MLWNIAGVISNGAIYQDPSTKRTYLYTADYYTNGPGDVRKLDADTGATVWEKAVLVPEGANILSSAVDGAGNLYLTGSWQSGREQWRDSTTDFDPGPGTFYLTSSEDFFALMISSSLS